MREELSSLRVFASYVPAEIVLRSLANHAPPSKADREDFPAAIGFVDVSGFTALSEKLLKEYGRRSSEMLNTYINSYFDGLIDGISEFGGDVIILDLSTHEAIVRHNQLEDQRQSDGLEMYGKVELYSHAYYVAIAPQLVLDDLSQVEHWF